MMFVWVKVFKNGPSNRLPSTNFTWSILECLDPFAPSNELREAMNVIVTLSFSDTLLQSKKQF